MRKGLPLLASVLWLAASSPVAVSQQQQLYTSSEGRFSVQFPAGDVKQDTDKVDLSDGGSSTLYEFWVEKSEGEVSYMVMYSDYPADYANGSPDEVLAGTRDGAVKGKTLVSDIAINLDGVPGREFTAKSDKWSFTVRQYLKNKRLYQLIVVANTDHPAAQTSDFLNSFKIQ